ncbi:MAG: DNA-binding protein WhiA [Synergistaceae bacterium]|jgi:DNA-binding protein WhiA|nr:DNA-binding protein WhiA [Synergistaceae bacterium]
MHSIVTELWDEWSSLPQADEETDSSEVVGLVAVLPFKKNEREGTTILRSSRLWALRRLLKLWKNSRWRNELNLAASMLVPSDMKGRVELVLPQKLYEAIASTKRENWAWARGVWGGCGAFYVPKSGYYLVMRTGEDAVVTRMKRVLRKAHAPWGERAAHGKRELILRDQQGIVTFLSKMELTGVSLLIEDKAILRTMRDQANRIRNCDTANIKKTLKAAEEQTALARTLLQNDLLSALPPYFQALVAARLEHPEESLSDLGKRLSPPVTKSTVKYRWKRLLELMEKEKENEMTGNHAASP